MRNIIKGAAFFFTISIVILVILDISLSGTKHNETTSLANESSYDALKIKLTGEYDLENNEDLVAELIKNVVINKTSNNDVKIQILGIDAKNGLIDINVIEDIKHVNGVTTRKQERRTVIIETEEKVEKFIYDFNNDNIVDEDDVKMIEDYLSGTSSLSDDQLKLADLNNDGIVNNDDVSLFRQKIVDNSPDIMQKK